LSRPSADHFFKKEKATSMKRLIPLVLLLMAGAAAGAVPGAEQTWKGVALVDTMCSAKVKSAPDKHTTSCAISCANGGFGIVAEDGTYLKFDEGGNKKALSALKATKKTDHIRATVVGERDGDTIKVKSLSLD
jgi:hypothetical protein